MLLRRVGEKLSQFCSAATTYGKLSAEYVAFGALEPFTSTVCHRILALRLRTRPGQQHHRAYRARIIRDATMDIYAHFFNALLV
jgi:hypothetical protein